MCFYDERTGFCFLLMKYVSKDFCRNLCPYIMKKERLKQMNRQSVLDEFTTAWNLAYTVKCPRCGARYSKRLLKCPSCGEPSPIHGEALREAEEVFERLRRYVEGRG